MYRDKSFKKIVIRKGGKLGVIEHSIDKDSFDRYKLNGYMSSDLFNLRPSKDKLAIELWFDNHYLTTVNKFNFKTGVEKDNLFKLQFKYVESMETPDINDNEDLLEAKKWVLEQVARDFTPRDISFLNNILLIDNTFGCYLRVQERAIKFIIEITFLFNKYVTKKKTIKTVEEKLDHYQLTRNF